jgi:hypothetical protein
MNAPPDTVRQRATGPFPAEVFRVSGKDHLASMALRVTTVFRLEDGEWKMVHRHADPLLGLQTPQSVTQK